MYTLSSGNVERMKPSQEFLDAWNSLSLNKKLLIKSFLYESVKTCLLRSDERMIEWYKGRYDEIAGWKTNINIPLTMEVENILTTDEQILFGINSSDREFYPARFLSRNYGDKTYLWILMIYINSSRVEKIAILKIFENTQENAIMIGVRSNLADI